MNDASETCQFPRFVDEEGLKEKTGGLSENKRS